MAYFFVSSCSDLTGKFGISLPMSWMTTTKQLLYTALLEEHFRDCVSTDVNHGRLNRPRTRRKRHLGPW